MQNLNFVNLGEAQPGGEWSAPAAGKKDLPKTEDSGQPKNRRRSEYIWMDEYGKPLEHDPNFRGPLQHRSCTDVICGFLFLLFLVAWGTVAFFAIKYGDPQKLLHPSDSKGQICGVTTDKYDMSGKPYLLFFDLTKCISYATVFEGCPTPQVCVEKCPTEYFSYFELLKSTQNNNILKNLLSSSFTDVVDRKVFCVEGFNKTERLKNFDDLKTAVNHGKCTAYTVASSPVVGRCIPELLAKAGTALADAAANETDQLATDGSEQIPNATSIANSERFLFAAGCLAFIWIVIMRWVAPFMVWFSIILVVLFLALGTAVCWWKYIMLKNNDGKEVRFTIDVKSYLQMTNLWLVVSIIVSIVFVTIVLLLLFLRSRIQVAIAMIKESSKVVVYIISALFFPLIPFLLHLTVLTFFILVAAHLASWGVPNCRRLGVDVSPVDSNNTADATSALDSNGTKCDCDDIGKPHEPYCIFVNHTHVSAVGWMQAANLFGFFWVMFFIDALGQMTLAGAFASYYWAFRKPDDIPTYPLLKGFWRAIRYHLGSVAFGSLILAIVRLIRVVLEYIEDKLKDTENPIVEFFTKCLKCCFWCLEKFIRFLNKNAYIMIAIYGNSFCKSAKDAFLLLMRNVVRVFVLDKLTDFLLFLGKLVITAGFGVLSYYYFSGFWSFNDILVSSLNFYFVPVIVVTFGTYMICCAFFGVYEMAVDTTFLCFLEDSERNDGSPEKPYFMSKNLMKILNKRNYFQKAKAKKPHDGE